MTGRLVIASAAVLVVVVAAAVWLAGRSGPEPAPAPSRAGAIGPSTDTEPYLLPVADGVRIRSLLSVEDGGSASDGYELTGLPDGLGAAAGEGSGFALLMNHEIDAGAGGVRRHGRRGAYVSSFTIDRVRAWRSRKGRTRSIPGCGTGTTSRARTRTGRRRTGATDAGAATSFRRRATRWCACVRAR